MNLRDKLIQTLAERFGASAFIVGASPEPDVTFPAAHPDVGSAQVWDDGHEMMVAVEHITHGHFSDFRENVTDEERADAVVESVTTFLSDLFAGRILLFGSAQGSGGWAHLDAPDSLRFLAVGQPTYLWTGPVTVDAAGTITAV